MAGSGGGAGVVLVIYIQNFACLQECAASRRKIS